MKNLVRKFAVINCNRSSDKVVLPMNQNAMHHILSLNNQELTDMSFQHLNLFTLSYYDNDEKFTSIRRMSKSKRYSDTITIRLDSSYESNKYLRMVDCNVKVTNRFFETIIQRTNLKWIQEGDDRFILVDDSLIPQGLTESFISKNKLVKKDSILEVYGDTSILSYHYSQWHPEVEKQFTKFMDKSEGAVNFGFEAEKIDSDYCEEGIAMKLAHETGFKKEYDGSLGSDGFELISPILPLFNQQVIDESINPVKYLLDAQSNEKCGGHFNISKNGTSSREILKSIKGSLPILYMMYEKRLDNRYCQVKKFSAYLRNPQKYSACYLKNSNVLEIRLFPAIKNESVLQNRINLTRMMMHELYGKSAIKVLIELANPTSNLHNFILNTILNGSKEKLVQKLIKFAMHSERYGCGKISLPTKKKVNKLMQCEVFHIPVEVPPTPTTPTDTTRPTPTWIPENEVENTEEDVVSQALNDVRNSSTDDSFAAPMSDATFHEHTPSELPIERVQYADTQYYQHSLRYQASNDFLYSSNWDMHSIMYETERFINANRTMSVNSIFRQVVVRNHIVQGARETGYINNTPNRDLIAQFYDNNYLSVRQAGRIVSQHLVQFMLKSFFVARYILQNNRVCDETPKLTGYLAKDINGEMIQLFYSIELDYEGNITGCFGEMGTGIQYVVKAQVDDRQYRFQKLHNITIS